MVKNQTDNKQLAHLVFPQPSRYVSVTLFLSIDVIDVNKNYLFCISYSRKLSGRLQLRFVIYYYLSLFFIARIVYRILLVCSFN